MAAAEPRSLELLQGRRTARGVANVLAFAQEGMGRGRRMSQERVTKEFEDRRKNPAYRNGWGDGRFGPTQSFLNNSNLAEWTDPQERLSYYRGHRDGRRAREMLAHGDSA
jgi:hypothetical protein